MKTLSDVKQDMSDLYDQVKSGTVEIKVAAELSNIAGKFLKADALELAREMFMREVQRSSTRLPAPLPVIEAAQEEAAQH